MYLQNALQPNQGHQADAAALTESTNDGADSKSYRERCQELLRAMNSWSGKDASNQVASKMQSKLSARLVELLSSRLENKAASTATFRRTNQRVDSLVRNIPVAVGGVPDSSARS